MKYFFFIPALLTIFSSFASGLSAHSYCSSEVYKSINGTKVPSIIGAAFNVDTQDFLYCEYYFELSENQFLTEYRDAEQSLIATKKVSYGANPLQPSVYQEDLRHGEIRQVDILRDVQESQGVLEEAKQGVIEVQYKKPRAEKAKLSQLPISSSLVIDAGFDEAVRRYWDDLIDDKKVEIDFLSIVHLKSFRLSISAISTSRCESPKFDKNETDNLCFKVRPSSSFLNFFAQPLYLKYDMRNKKLLMFRGNVNITAIDGATQSAAIFYTYNE